jgi:Uma2 family endonuclease
MMAVGTRVTAQAFLALPESNQLRELINGEIVVNPPNDGHQVCAGNLYFYLRQHVPDGRVRIAPTGLYVDEANIVEPEE